MIWLRAVLISSLGLFDMIAFNAERRTKETSFRKVPGASVAGIVQLLSAESLKIIIVSKYKTFSKSPLS